MEDNESALVLEDVERQIGDLKRALDRTAAFINQLEGSEIAAEYLAEMKARHEGQLRRLEHRRDMLLMDDPEGG